MHTPGKMPKATCDVENVRKLISQSIADTSLTDVADEISTAFIGGKMLRARLTLRMGRASGAVTEEVCLNAAAAIEMVHAASLLHDDVVDGGILRRGAPTFWRTKGIAGAVLLGDLMVCKAFACLNNPQSRHLSALLVQLTGEMCDAEAAQELTSNRKDGDLEQSVLLARRKTGSLFAFAAAASCEPDTPQSAALLEAGYKLGTAYQLADDVLDASDASTADGKDLGQDAKRDKLTSVSAKDSSKLIVIDRINSLVSEACALLEEWPAYLEAWNEYLQTSSNPS